jgi:hypothetical protein
MFPVLRPMYGEFLAYNRAYPLPQLTPPIVSRMMLAPMAIVDHNNPGAWHGTSETAPVTTVACASDAEVCDGLLGALDSHEFVFGRFTMGLGDALGSVCPLHPSYTIELVINFSTRDHAQGGLIAWLPRRPW